MKAIVILSLSIALSSGEHEHELTNRGFSMRYDGQSNSFNLHATLGAENTAKFWCIKYQHLYEVDASGNKISSRAVSRSVATVGLDVALETAGCWPGAVPGPYALTLLCHLATPTVALQLNNLGLDVSNDTNSEGRPRVLGRQRLSGTIGSGSVSFVHTLFDAAATVKDPSNGRFVSVPADSLKIAFHIEGWTFASSENKLVLEVKIHDNEAGHGADGAAGPSYRGRSHRGRSHRGGSGPGGGPRHVQDSAAPDASAEEVYALPCGDGATLAIAFETVAYIDGAAAPVPVSVRNEVGSNIFKLVFPSFNSTLWYDPTVGVMATGATSGAASASLGGYSSLLRQHTAPYFSLLAVFLASMAVLLIV